MPTVVHESAEPQTLDEIRNWHRDVVDALAFQMASVKGAIQSGAAVATRFVGMTEADVDAHYDGRRRELDRLTVLNLVASVEASIRTDFARRVDGKLKDPLARAYQEWNKTLSSTKQRRPDFDEGGILDILKQAHVINNHIVGQYRECLRARHWVGHGRYWAKPVEVDSLDPDDAYARADALLKAMPQ